MVLFALLALISCEQVEIPDPIEDTPEFYISGEINGEPFLHSAGVDGNYMHTRSLVLSNNISQFQSFIGPSDCDDCQGFLTFELNAADQTNSSLTNGLNNMDFQEVEVRKIYTIDFESHYFSNPINPTVSYDWDINGTKFSDPSPSITIEDESELDIRLIVNGGQSDIQGKVYLGSPNQSLITHQRGAFPNTNNTIDFKANISGAQSDANDNVWTFDAGFPQSGPNVSHQYGATPSQNVSLVKLESTFDNGDVRIDYKNVIIDSNAAVPFAAVNYSYSVTEQTIEEIKEQEGKFELSFIDQNGTSYSTSWTDQGNNDYFNILSLEEYELNEAGNPTLKAEIEFSLTLSNGTEELRIENGRGVIAFEYQK